MLTIKNVILQQNNVFPNTPLSPTSLIIGHAFRKRKSYCYFLVRLHSKTNRLNLKQRQRPILKALIQSNPQLIITVRGRGYKLSSTRQANNG